MNLTKKAKDEQTNITRASIFVKIRCSKWLFTLAQEFLLPTRRCEINENLLPAASTLSFCASSKVKKSLLIQLEPLLQLLQVVVFVDPTMKSNGGGGREGSTTISLNDFHRMMSLIFTTVVMLTSLLHTWLLLLLVLVFLLEDDSLRERLLGRESTEGDFEVKREMLLMVFMSVWKGDEDLSSISMRLCMLLLLVGFLGSDLKPLEEHEFRFSLRKSFSILGLRSIELNLFSCVLILEGIM